MSQNSILFQGNSSWDKNLGRLMKKLGLNFTHCFKEKEDIWSEFITPNNISYKSHKNGVNQILNYLNAYHSNLCVEILWNHDLFLSKILRSLDQTSIDYKDLSVDHIARRTSTFDHYHDLQSKINNIWTLLLEEDINWRPISIYQFHLPLNTVFGEIPYLELIAPKQWKIYPDAYDHVEFVTKQNLRDLLSQYPDIDFQTKWLNNKTNPALELEFEENLSVKFHNQWVDEVLDYEK